MNDKFKNIVLAVGVVLSAVWTVISLILDIWGQIHDVDLRYFALGGFIIFIILVSANIFSLRNLLYSKIPNIDVYGDVNPHDVNMGNFLTNKGKKVFVLKAISNMVSVPFSNRPKNPTKENNVDNVRAEISYLDENKNPLFPQIQGRWGVTYQPSDINSGETRKIESVDFPSNGAIRSLDLLIKYPEDEYCYGYNNDSYYSEGSLFLHPAYKIERRRFFIQVNLLGANIPNKPWIFEVITKGRGDTFKIRYKETWKRTNNSQSTKTLVKLVKIEKGKSSLKKASQKIKRN